MYSVLLKKIRESFVSVVPVAAIVLILYMTPLVSLSLRELVVFLISAFFLILGIGLFNLGADLAMTPMGEQVGSGLARTGNTKLLLGVACLMGVLITIAEPDLSVLAGQVSAVMNGTLLIVAVGVGVGIFLVLSILKMIFRRFGRVIFCRFWGVIYPIFMACADGEKTFSKK